MSISNSMWVAQKFEVSHTKLKEQILECNILQQEAFNYSYYISTKKIKVQTIDCSPELMLIALAGLIPTLRYELFSRAIAADDGFAKEIMGVMLKLDDDNGFKPLHKVFTFPKPNPKRKHTDFVVISALANKCGMGVFKMRSALVKLGLAIVEPDGKTLTPTTRGNQYAKPFRNYYVWDRDAIYKIVNIVIKNNLTLDIDNT